MSAGADQYRLAVAVFDDPDRLWSALRVLVHGGLGLDQICLVASASTMERLPAPGSDRAALGQIAEVLTLLLDRTTDPAGRDLVATPGPLLEALRQVADAQHNAVNGTSTAGTSVRPKIADHVFDGAITLFVRSNTPVQQSLATRALLSQSSRIVKTFEFTLAA